ncbi:cytochrome C oxidase subunit II [Flavobacterium magnum]|uniref:cytochrome-c oxidase n=1 Tax=Flavobacterium magnum TaxID=2162713 RepID=A0A2S0RE55_9FLAO|nr:cytochrome c oxidase subunit II [Flavobacterium magnum]AWA29528.1 cytochrome C oxidase subunit II [Flavobacterium magnum]
MTSWLVIIVLVLLSIAVWQLTKIFDLTQVGGQANRTEVADDKDNNVQGYLMFGFLAFIYIFTIYGLLKWGHFVLSNPASEHGKEIDRLMNITWVLIFIVQAVTQVLLHYFAFKYRGKKEQKALYFADNSRLEVIWSVIPAVVLAGLILYGLYAWTNIMFVNEKTEKVMVVEVYAKQFQWEARYSGTDNVLGKANVRYIEGVNTLGVDMSDPNAQDDKTATELHLPKGVKVLFKFRSQDVLHSAYFPHFRAQMNCVPGMVTQFAFTPTITTQEMRANEDMIKKVENINRIRSEKSKKLVAEGKTALDPYVFDYLLLCNKICGPSHYNMQMKVVIDEPQDFKKWIDGQKTLAQAVKEDKASKEAPAQEAPTATPAAADSTKTMAQLIKK